MPLWKKFDKVFQQNLFHGGISKSGNGSTIEQTQQIAEHLPALISEMGIQSVLDIPCGDLEWMKRIDLGGAKYIGADVAPSLIAYLDSQFPDREFRVLNITKDVLPKVDLIFCRDLFVHLSNKDIRSAIRNIQLSGSKYLATTTFTQRLANKDLPFLTRAVAWRTLNLEKTPFNFPIPQTVIDEECTEADGAFSDKTIAIWEIAKLPN